MTGRRLVELSGTAATTALGPDSIIVIPTGAIEHHGPHLPLNTDALLAGELAEAAVDRAAADGLDIWILPTLSYTKSDEHHWAPGTIWLSWETLMATLVDIGRSVAATPARTLVFMNGHGGNGALLQVANRELRRRFGLRTFTMPAGIQRAGTGAGAGGGAGAAADPLAGADELGLGIHAGHGETSLVLHVRPDLVDMSLAERNVPEHVAGFEYIGFNNRPVSFGWMSNDFGPSGVIGDPTLASAEAGATLFDESVAASVAALHEIARFRHGAGQS
ncbi:creatininase family protein [Marisediminicola senii]|uniref:creatininase family protein n=1 Tax=Marisediminicola senii TaxID=2711233 RepID=UPI0013EA9333|nr:creatininase family protein [Marisediminicola senii]